MHPRQALITNLIIQTLRFSSKPNAKMQKSPEFNGVLRFSLDFFCWQASPNDSHKPAFLHAF